MEQALQQPQLIEIPKPPQCFHCASTQATVLHDREIIVVRLKCTTDCVCCTPDSDYHCPVCNSSKLQFGMRYASADGEETGEVYRCETCGAAGDVGDAAPPVEPWAELEAVAQGGFRMGIRYSQSGFSGDEMEEEQEIEPETPGEEELGEQQ
jgi:hypothetical protein